MGLMDAQEYDPRPAQRRWRLIITAVVVIAVPLGVWYFFFYYWPEEHVVNRFFQAIERKDFETAYAIWEADPNWKQHPEKYPDYTLNQFRQDWGPQGEYGVITSHEIDCSTELPKKDFQTASGVIVVVKVNKIASTKSLWVEKKSESITFSPREVVCHAGG
jgi:hypothetical protein